MGFTCGIVGLPNVGKTTLFNAQTAAGAAVSNYPFCTIDPNVGVVPVPDERLDFLARIRRPAKIIPSVIQFVDIAGLVRGASTGEGLGNQFLAHIREMDALGHVVRCFDDPNIVHVDGSVNPIRDIEIVEAELILKDLETVERRLAETQKIAKAGDKKTQAEAELYRRVRTHLAEGRLVRSLGPAVEEPVLRELHLLTAKPVMYICNIQERDSEDESQYVQAVLGRPQTMNAVVVTVSAAIEAEIAELPLIERKSFRNGLGMKSSGLDEVVRAGYDLLGLRTFFTANERELHAWTVPGGTKAPAAAGVIHTDFERGFIRAEVTKFVDILRLASDQAVKEAGLLHLEGKEYIVEDGDLIFFRFNV